MSAKEVARRWVPPALWGMVSRSRSQHLAAGTERDSAYYDKTFSDAEHFKLDYVQSRYYPMWAVVADRLTVGLGSAKVLDLGCGPGQFASHLRDRGTPAYLGLDFSSKRVDQARTLDLPDSYEFIEADVYKTDVFENTSYDVVTATEFLEHIHSDLAVLERIRPGTPVIGTVPNFGGPAHVRFFDTTQAVSDHYESVLDDLEITPLRGEGATVYFVLQGVARKSH